MLPQVQELSVKLALDTTVKRLSVPQNYKELETQARLLATNVGCAPSEKLAIFYIDTDEEKIAIQDDSDLHMSYALALTSDRRVKYMIAIQDRPQNFNAFNSPVKME